jgi:Protein of unknown function (DUF2950)
MKISNQFTRVAELSTIALLAGACGILPASLYAADPNQAPPQPAVAQRLFASPDEALKALQTATAAKDRAALGEIFGPQLHELSTGDQVQDANNQQKFAAALADGCKPVAEGEDKIIFEVGTNNWPMPIPLVKVDGQWHFDTAAGKEEVINRHIGKDELHAISFCRAYVIAQRKYAKVDAGQDASYAMKFTSTPGTRDGLYWPAVADEAASPFGHLVAQEQAEGIVKAAGAGLQPFHGYYFRILSRQGKDAPGGKKNYMSEGLLSGGYALVAYPEHWDKSGIMTFIVNQDGQVFERNLAENTTRIASKMQAYNPDNNWTLVKDDGVSRAISER